MTTALRPFITGDLEAIWRTRGLGVGRCRLPSRRKQRSGYEALCRAVGVASGGGREVTADTVKAGS